MTVPRDVRALVRPSAITRVLLYSAICQGILPGRSGQAVAGPAACAPVWSDQFAGFDIEEKQTFKCLAPFDPDGEGPQPALIALGGRFKFGPPWISPSVLLFDGVTYRKTEGDPTGYVSVLAVMDEDESGPRMPSLFAGGSFLFLGDQTPAMGIARFDGQRWSPVGGGLAAHYPNSGGVQSMLVVDSDGPGAIAPVLVVSGDFDTADGQPARYIAQWDGRRWAALGDGLKTPAKALAFFDPDDEGPERPLLVASSNHAGDDENPWIGPSAWDGEKWSRLAPAPDAEIQALCQLDEGGAGPRRPCLIAGGEFAQAGGVACNRVARWDGSSWSALAEGPSVQSGEIVRLNLLTTLEKSRNQSGDRLLVAGGIATLQQGGPEAIVALWDGQRWRSASAHALLGFPRALATIDLDGAGPQKEAIYACGDLAQAGPVLINTKLTKLVEGEWQQADRVSPNASNSGASLSVVATFDSDGTGPVPPELVVNMRRSGGSFPLLAANRWNGQRWSAHPILDSAWIGVTSAIEFDEDELGPRPPHLYTGGIGMWQLNGPGMLRWGGHEWAPPPGIPAGWVYAMCRWDPDGDGPQPSLLVASLLDRSAAGSEVFRVMRFDGQTWADVGIKGGTSWNGIPWVLCEYDADGPGGATPRLIAAGSFTTVDGIRANGVAGWDGAAWSGLGSGFGGDSFGSVSALAVFDGDGKGPQPPTLIAGGRFQSANGVPTNNIARWDGSGWSSLGGGVTGVPPRDGRVSRMAVFDEDGAGPAGPSLYVVGWFDVAGDIPSRQIAKWDGERWHEVCAFDQPEPGNSFWLSDVLAFDPDGPGPNQSVLVVTGRFSSLCGRQSLKISALTAFPWIYEQPENLRITPGQSAFFRVHAGGSGSLSYQWRRRGENLIDGPLVSGAQTPTLVLKNANDPGPYDVEIRNDCGPIVSMAARLIVRGPPPGLPGPLRSE